MASIIRWLLSEHSPIFSNAGWVWEQGLVQQGERMGTSGEIKLWMFGAASAIKVHLDCLYC